MFAVFKATYIVCNQPAAASFMSDVWDSFSILDIQPVFMTVSVRL